MKEVGYFIAKVISKIKGEKYSEHVIKWFRAKGISIGENCHIYSNILTPEPFLIELGNNVTISSFVIFVTHDNSICTMDNTKPNLYGYIKIGNNCFIGERTTILYGVSLPNNCVVAAGSVVVNPFSEERIIIGGSPARIIGHWEDFLERNKDKAISRFDIKNVYKTNPEKLVRRKIK